MAGVYLHIPFCRRRCSYCDFYSVVSTADADRYVSALISELRLRRNEICLADVRTIYLGGGTPSVLSCEQIRRLMHGMADLVDMSRVEEVTIEVNPDDVDCAFINNVVACGINRVSMGVQSFVDDELRAVNRRHNAQQAIDAVKTMKNNGIDNISVDLIYGLPGQTLESWSYSLARAVELPISHISAYCLSYEEGTALTRLRDRGKIVEVDEETCVRMCDMLCSALKDAGFEHYEISNFALPGMYSRHNSSYWDGTPYLGLGAAAHSFDGKCRRYNPSELKIYLANIENDDVVYETETEEWWQHYNEMVMVKLRTMWGIDLNDVENRFGRSIADDFRLKAKQYVQSGAMQCKGTRYVLTQQGVMISDAIIRDLMIIGDYS
ncbi:MAG: radical SAM family heme chaperone HemW [Muribaculaceae bacterium]